MATAPEISVIVSTFQRPRHLKRCLTSISLQQDMKDLFEVVVADDGSTDETTELVDHFSSTVDFTVSYTTHEHDGFRLSQSRNEGAIASRGSYLLFTDGDCILPPRHLVSHMRHRRRGRVITSDMHRLDQDVSWQIDCEKIRESQFARWASTSERHRIAQKAFRSRFYNVLRVPMRPRITGNNIGIWRTDFEQVNGFDEQFVGWGLEDRDLQRRLEMIGVHAKSILPWAAIYHLWHDTDCTFSRKSLGTQNLEYYQSKRPNVRCTFGLTQRREAVGTVQSLRNSRCAA